MAAPIRPNPRTAIARDEVMDSACGCGDGCHKRISDMEGMRNTHTRKMALITWRTFLTVCRLGSLSAAAAELGYTQSAVSRQIAGLEREVGAPLVERHARGIRPTAAGEAFRYHAQAAVNEAERAFRAARDARDGSPVRPLAVGATPSLAAGVVPGAMRRLLDETGPLQWNLVPGLTGELHERMVSGELDVAIVTDAPPGLPSDSHLDRQFLGTDEMVVVLPAGHRLAGSVRTRIETLADETWAEDNEGSAALLRQHAARAGVIARIDLHAADLPGKIALAATGHAVALVPGVLATALRADVTTLALVDPPTRGIYAILPRIDPHPSTAQLLRDIVMCLRLGRTRKRDVLSPGSDVSWFWQPRLPDPS
jgi:DNA-binding transcriptional LysR family regulator